MKESKNSGAAANLLGLAGTLQLQRRFRVRNPIRVCTCTRSLPYEYTSVAQQSWGSTIVSKAICMHGHALCRAAEGTRAPTSRLPTYHTRQWCTHKTASFIGATSHIVSVSGSVSWVFLSLLVGRGGRLAKAVVAGVGVQRQPDLGALGDAEATIGLHIGAGRKVRRHLPKSRASQAPQDLVHQVHFGLTSRTASGLDMARRAGSGNRHTRLERSLQNCVEGELQPLA